MLLHFVLTIVAVARAAACVGSAALCTHVLCYLQWHAEDAGVPIVVAVFLWLFHMVLLLNIVMLQILLHSSETTGNFPKEEDDPKLVTL